MKRSSKMYISKKGNHSFRAYKKQKYYCSRLGKGNLIFYCTGLTNPKFWMIKIKVILILYIFYSDLYSCRLQWNTEKKN